MIQIQSLPLTRNKSYIFSVRQNKNKLASGLTNELIHSTSQNGIYRTSNKNIKLNSFLVVRVKQGGDVKHLTLMLMCLPALSRTAVRESWGGGAAIITTLTLPTLHSRNKGTTAPCCTTPVPLFTPTATHCTGYVENN